MYAHRKKGLQPLSGTKITKPTNNYMSSVTLVEKYPQNKKSTVAIRPYFNQRVDNMGLQNYGLSLFDGAYHEEQLSCLEVNGIKRYVTGLNEFAPELIDLSPEEREAKIKQIRIIVSQLEKQLASNVVDPNDEQFWNKIKLLSPNNSELWDKIKIRVGNEALYLEPEKDPYDLIKLYAIEAGGFSMVAKSLDEARNMSSPPKFYLDKIEQTASTNTEVKKLRNKALSELEKLYNKNQNKLYYVAKLLDANSAQYKKSTPNDIIYDNMDKFINGEAVDKDKRRTAQKFLDAAGLDLETLKIRAIVKDAGYYKMIATKADGFIYHMTTSTMMGRNPADAAEFLKNPLNEQILVELQKAVEVYWNQ
jgi:hypothetical protein